MEHVSTGETICVGQDHDDSKVIKTTGSFPQG